jgi:hypothetical protein
MKLYNILDSVEEKLLDLNLFVRYLDYSDLEALGLVAQDESEGSSGDVMLASRGTHNEISQRKHGVPGGICALRDGI